MKALDRISAHLGPFVLLSLVHHFTTVKPPLKNTPPPPRLFKGKKLMNPLSFKPPSPPPFILNLSS